MNQHVLYLIECSLSHTLLQILIINTILRIDTRMNTVFKINKNIITFLLNKVPSQMLQSDGLMAPA